MIFLRPYLAQKETPKVTCWAEGALRKKGTAVAAIKFVVLCGHSKLKPIRILTVVQKAS